MHTIFRISLLIAIVPFSRGWGYDGHVAVCRIAQARLNKAAAEAVRKLLPASAKGDLGILCPWPDQIRMRYPWSSALHYVNTPDNLCSYKYKRDCKDTNGATGRCVTGAIKNYTSILMNYKKPRSNLTEALLFLSHFMGDVHQPMHVGFVKDKGGNTIKVNWFGQKQVLHRVWDSSIIAKAEGGSNPSNLDKFIKNIQHKIQISLFFNLLQQRLSNAAANAVSQLLPEYANNDLGSVCSWADRVKFRYHWSSPLHYIDTPDNLCTYQYKRDCKDEDGIQDRCVAGAINNYTTQLLTYSGNSDSSSQYNLTEALLFLSHFMGDIHQPLHVGFTSDRGANTIDVHWYRRKEVLHHVSFIIINLLLFFLI
ncbi:PREDICTED: endonuclease 2-like [Erythranthe guttata]|uniref:endonuclease 2-like n=1 Tax=Erythranthe guttata TaxID=4155 RepID=UPI00064E0FFF|nr:PREDICTED: endonuclease 2-like [Erythranthe guttata]|eukprot:XP_012845947.1 PREDICTED: endonuclease 2-like [Erythranthe guttata]